jgi:hypothetical protein
MIKFLQMLEKVFAAAAFAERGEWETARFIAGSAPNRRPPANPRKAPARPRLRVST